MAFLGRQYMLALLAAFRESVLTPRQGTGNGQDTEGVMAAPAQFITHPQGTDGAHAATSPPVSYALHRQPDAAQAAHSGSRQDSHQRSGRGGGHSAAAAGARTHAAAEQGAAPLPTPQAYHAEVRLLLFCLNITMISDACMAY